MTGVIDAFIFNDELDVLKFRLYYLNGFVDDVVIVEGLQTFAGVDKPLYASNSLEDLSRLTDARIHIVISTLASTDDRWKNEWSARETLLQYVKENFPNEVAIFADVDEIPSRAQVAAISQNQTVLRWDTPDFYRRANWRLLAGTTSVVAGPVGQLAREVSAMQKLDPRFESIGKDAFYESGAHFGYLGFNAASISRKYAAFSHSELDRPDASDPRIIHLADELALDHLGRIQLPGLGLLRVTEFSALSEICKCAVEFHPAWGEWPLERRRTTSLKRLGGAALLFQIVERERTKWQKWLPEVGQSPDSWWHSIPILVRVALFLGFGEALVRRIWGMVRAGFHVHVD